MLAARDITVALRGRLLLDRVSLAVAPGETVAVLGENGAGKTTLLKVLAGDRLPSRARVDGRVELAGRAIGAWSLRERARLRAVLPQRPEVAFAFTASEVVALGRFAASGAAGGRQEGAIVAESLALADAAHLAGREVATLSGGEQARVHLAAALAQLWDRDSAQDRYLLLDEPTAALDLAHQHHMLATARAFAATRRIGIVAILHDLNLAAAYADRVALLRAGSLLAEGAPREVLQPATVAAGFGVAASVLVHPLTAGILIATAARDVRASAA